MNRQRFLSRKILVSAISAATLAASQGAMAQGGALEEIIVTAQKRAESSQDAALSITALSENAVERRGIANTGDLVGELPGVGGFSSPGSRGATSISIRGVSGGSPANLSLDPAVALYIDGVYLGKQVGSALDVAEIERIELVRGPQGTLYGRNATGGAVNVITKRPTGEFGVRVQGSVGNYDYRTLKANVDLPAVGTIGEGAGQLAASLAYQTRQRDGFYDNNSGNDDFNDMDRDAYRLALTWDITDSFSADYTYDHSELQESHNMEKVVGFTAVDPAQTISRIAALQGTLAGAQGLAQIPGADPRISSRWIPSLQETIDVYQAAEASGDGRVDDGRSDFDTGSDNEVEGHALTLSWDAGDMGVLGDVSFKSITSYRELETYVSGDIENIDSSLDANGVGAYSDLVHLTLGQLYGTEVGIFGVPNGAIAGSLWAGIDDIGAFHTKQDTTTNYEQFSQELQMVGSTDRVDYVLGLYYFEDEGEYYRRATFAAPLAGRQDQFYANDTEAWAAFSQASWTPNGFDDRLELTLGLRYTEEDKGIFYDYGDSQTPFGVTPGAGELSRDESFSNVSGNFTVAYQFTDELNTFLRYATGYRSGGFNGEIFDNPFDEETIEQWELGFKSDWWDNRLRINGSLWTYDWDDLQIASIEVVDGVATSSFSNSGLAERWGGELEVLVSPIADLVVGLSYSYINGHYEEFPDVCGPTGVCASGIANARRGASPSNTFSVNADYVFARTSLGDITGYLQVNWQDEWYESALWSGVDSGSGLPIIYPHQVMDQRTVVDARLNLESIPVGNGTMRVSLWGKNLTDDDYPTFSINFGSLGLVTEQYGDPRTYGLEVAYEY